MSGVSAAATLGVSVSGHGSDTPSGEGAVGEHGDHEVIQMQLPRGSEGGTVALEPAPVT